MQPTPQTSLIDQVPALLKNTWSRLALVKGQLPRRLGQLLRRSHTVALVSGP